jgi:hypothetical protein
MPLLASTLAGFSDVDGIDPVEALGPGTFMLAMAEPPANGPNGTSFQLIVKNAHPGNGPFAGTSDHIGATTRPRMLQTPMLASAKRLASAPTWLVAATCPATSTSPARGTPAHYRRDHVRMSDGDTPYNFWTKSVKVVIGDVMA